jgi:thioredoxin-related protein
MKKLLFFFLVFTNLLFASELFNYDNKLVADGKAVMFIFESKTCPYCEILKKDFANNKEMNALAKKFNIYLINQDVENDYIIGATKRKETTTTLRMAFMVKGTPNIIMFDKKWNKIFQLPGYADPSQMITFMKFVQGIQDGKYKSSQWKEFLKDNGVS